MSRPEEDLSGTLPYRTEPRRSPRLSLYHLKLTDSALRCLRDFQRGQGSGSLLPQPVITFQGNQGYIKIPSPISGSEDRVQIFSFYLSRESKDKPQSSFECIRQGTLWSGEKKLSCVGSIQDKITVCATDESYQLTRDRMSQVEKETWSRTAIEIKPGASYRSKCVKIPSKNSMEHGKEGSPCNRHPTVFLTPAAKKCNRVNGEHRPLQEWLIHLLAIKPHRKQDVVLRLEKAHALPKEQTELQSTLDMVGRLSAKDGSYSLREELYCQVQRNWPGYTPEEKQHMADILSRKQHNISSSRNCLTTNPAASSHPNGRVRPPEAKRPASTETAQNENCKKTRGLDLDSRRKDEKYSKIVPDMNSMNSKSLDKSSVSENHHHKTQDTHRTVCKSQHKEPERGPKPCNVPDTVKTKHREATSQVHKMTEWCKERKREHDSSEEAEEDDDDEWEEEALLLERCLGYAEEKQQFNESSPASEEAPDYIKKYSTITSPEQQKMYEDDFASDYTEYLELHAKIGKVLDRFVYLGSKKKKLKPGTVEHKVIENKILTEYKKLKKTYPGYREEKSRCEYLHHKLSHIKYLILEYEKNKPT
ncbi:RNA polymerase II elongation factor ELL3 [Pelobates fuscus]|uniref:RNA polymerase II elongation factor ELL3 n=1 Tax=Pelobates fuscus TaxID=191477 RepID=UPI002FE4C947